MIGRSGAGKSSLLRLINRLAEPSAGRVVWQGTDVTSLMGRRLRDWRRRCAMIFQQFNLVGRLDVLNNVLLGRLAHAPGWRAILNAWPAQDRAIAFAALDQLDMASLSAASCRPTVRRPAATRGDLPALVQEPDLVLADEPVASLDPRNARIVMDTLLRINRHFGLTVICNLHALDIARSYCDRLIGMAAGQVVFDDVPAALTDAAARELYGMEADDAVGSILKSSHAAAAPELARA